MNAGARTMVVLLATAWVTGLGGAVLAGTGCLISTCVRHSDCGSANICEDGECTEPPIAIGSSGTSDSSDTGGNTDAATTERAPPTPGSTSGDESTMQTGTGPGDPMRPPDDGDTDGKSEATTTNGPSTTVTPDPTDSGTTTDSDGSSSDGSSSYSSSSDSSSSDGSSSGGMTGDGSDTGSTTGQAQDGASVINDSGVAQLTGTTSSSDSGTSPGAGGTTTP